MVAYHKASEGRKRWSDAAVKRRKSNASRITMDTTTGPTTEATTGPTSSRVYEREGEQCINTAVDYLTKNNDTVKTHTTPVAPPQTLALTNQPAPKLKRARSQCTEAPPGFVAWWKAYPNKSGKSVALQSWLRDEPDPVVLMRALEWQVKSEKWTKDGGAFIPMPATYLNQRRYEDEPVAPTRNLSPTTIANQAAVREFLEKDKQPLYTPGDDDDDEAPF
jgi:hypothetical protein